MTLYVLATPIGNLGDLSPRALETLQSCPIIAAEDTRRTRGLLAHFAVTGKKLVALHAHSSAADVERLLASLTAGDSVALVSDAGTPLVSDPGDSLVRAAVAAGISVVPIPGASAVLAALVGSGLGDGTGFRFVGFLPREGPPRRAALARVASTEEAVVLFESPRRTTATLRELAEATPARPACIARELTKLHEEFVRGSCAALAALDREWIGEVVLVLGPHQPESREAEITDALLDARIDTELAAGAHAKNLAERLAAWSGRSKRELYERILGRKGR